MMTVLTGSVTASIHPVVVGTGTTTAFSQILYAVEGSTVSSAISAYSQISYAIEGAPITNSAVVYRQSVYAVEIP